MDQLQSNEPLPPVFIPDELIVEIFSFLSVETITRFKCLSKSWKTLISNPTFVKKHLHKSSQNPHFILTQTRNYPMGAPAVVSLPLRCILEDSSMTVAGDSCRSLDGECCEVVGSINGLLCLLFNDEYEYWFRLCNPATGTISRELGFLLDYKFHFGSLDFSFGYDYLTGDYKVVACRVEGLGDHYSCKTRVLSLGDDCWREIESFPLLPFIPNNGVHLSGTVNWLVVAGGSGSKFLRIGNKAYAHDVELLSLDLSTETYTRFLLPESFDDSSRMEPSLRVLMDCLCCSQDFERTEFVIWQMKEFGIQDSWTQLFRIEYINLQMHNLNNDDLLVGYDESVSPSTKLLPLYLSKNGDTLILQNEDGGVIMYNRRDKRFERTTICDEIGWCSAIDHVESLVSTPYTSEDIEEQKWYLLHEIDHYRGVDDF